MSNLTAKQEKFCHNIVKGMTQIDSYKDAYDAGGMLDNSIKREASLLRKGPNISQTIDKLRQPIVKKTGRTLETILEEIDNIKVANIGEDDKLALDCLKHEAKLKGYEVEKKIVTGAIAITDPTDEAFFEIMEKTKG